MNRFIYLITLLLVFTFSVNAAGFEGKLTITRITYRYTTYYEYFVKDNLVRIDELNTKHQIQATLIFDLTKQSILALNHLRKVYIDYQPVNLNRDYSLSVVRKTTDSKKINGFTCKKWTVSNPSLDTKAVFWVTDGKENMIFSYNYFCFGKRKTV